MADPRAGNNTGRCADWRKDGKEYHLQDRRQDGGKGGCQVPAWYRVTHCRWHGHEDDSRSKQQHAPAEEQCTHTRTRTRQLTLMCHGDSPSGGLRPHRRVRRAVLGLRGRRAGAIGAPSGGVTQGGRESEDSIPRIRQHPERHGLHGTQQNKWLSCVPVPHTSHPPCLA